MTHRRSSRARARGDHNGFLIWREIGVIAAALLAASCASRPVAPESACAAPDAFAPAAQAERLSLDTLDLTAFGRPERGWAVYAPLASHELGVPCPPGAPAFAAALARWQDAHALPASGVMDAASFGALKSLWQSRRPFLAVRAQGVCPAPPPEAALASAQPGEIAGKPVQLRKRALKAYRRMAAAARRALPDLDAETLRIFSGYRSPAYDDARCAAQGNCDGVARAQCSAHRTGLALDLMLGAAPGFAVDSSAAQNRRWQAATPAYRWLVANAARFGFVNYPFEPWHWEWTGEAVRPSF
jgi:hypothetical protein